MSFGFVSLRNAHTRNILKQVFSRDSDAAETMHFPSWLQRASTTISLGLPTRFKDVNSNDKGQLKRCGSDTVLTRDSLNKPFFREPSRALHASYPVHHLDITNILDGVWKNRHQKLSSMTIDTAFEKIKLLYPTLPHDAKVYFITHLATEYGVDYNIIVKNSQEFLLHHEISQGRSDLLATERLKGSLIAPYQWLFLQMGRLEGGVKFLVDLRSDLLNTMEGMNTTGDMGQNLRAMDHALKETLTLWFSVGFLTLERVTWNSPCAMLQKISEYEAVHPVRNWTDLKRRVGPYRRCFVYTHHSMPGEPIVVLHTALTNEISQSIASIVARTHVHSIDQETMGGVGKEGKMEDCSHINTAIFYSITSTHKGLKGIDMGNYLIKQVVKKLQMEFPDMKQFSSLSPIPGFRSWLLTVLHKAERGEVCILEPQEESELSHLLSCEKSQFWKELQNVIGKNKWIQDDRMVNALETPLLRLCVQYLAIEKHRGYALNSVANFHLRNGAMIWRVNWKADLSPRGLSGSCSIMVNYRYFLDACEINSQHYLEEYQIEASEQVLHLAQRAQDVASMSRRSKL